MDLIVVVLLLIAVWAIFIYNFLIRDKNRVLAAWSDIDVQLKRRHDLIPKLVDAVRAYTNYERSTLDAITRLRSEAEQVEHPLEKAHLEHDLGLRMKKLIAVAEDYPELKSNEQYMQLLQQLSEVEDHIQYARRFYNGSVRDLNVRIDSFPDMIIANLFNFEQADFFEMEKSIP